MMRRTTHQLAIAVVLLFASTPSALAEQPHGGPPPPAAPATEETPWSRGVPQDKRDKAQRLLEEGNELFLKKKHREALALYQQAIAAWDHPAIRFNIVRVLINLDRPVEAYENLERALAYGHAPLDDEVFAEAQNYRRLLGSQIAELAISCAQPGVRVTLDGQEFLTCPGAQSARLLPGSHQVAGKKTGFLTLTREVVVMPGARDKIDVKLLTIAEATTTERRWAAWKPWAVVGGGAILGGLGVALRLQAQADYDQYRRDLNQICGEVPCPPEMLPGATRDLADRANLEDGLAIGAMVTCGAVVVTGLTLVILNRPQSVLPDQPEPPATHVIPMVTGHSLSAALIRQF